MKRALSALTATLIAFTSAHGETAPPPPPQLAQALLDAAFETGDPAEIEAVARAVRAVFADYTDAIDAAAAAMITTLQSPDIEPTVAPTPNADAKTAHSGKSAAPADDPQKSWSGKFQAGANFASGNSNTLATGIALKIDRLNGPWLHEIRGNFDIGRSDGVTKQKRWGSSYKAGYNFNGGYAYGRFSFEEDAFSGFDYRVFGGLGLGYYLLDQKTAKWSVELGPGYRYSPVDETTRVEREVALFGSTELDWLIRDGVELEQIVNATWTQPTTTLQSVTSLTTVLTDALSTALSFEVRHETDPPDDKVKTDLAARASLTYGF
ncbi:MAG: DUF481 domain-containing protein [Pseudomonadota bacterium]